MRYFNNFQVFFRIFINSVIFIHANVVLTRILSPDFSLFISYNLFFGYFFDKSDMILSLDKIENLDISSHHFSIKSCGIKEPVIFRFRNIYYCFKNDQFFLKFCHFIKKTFVFQALSLLFY